MKKRFILPILMLIFALSSVLFIGTACSNDKGDNDETNNEIYSIYTTYVAYAEENGQAPLSYEDWLLSIKGEKGDDGKDGVDGTNGKDGKTPTIEISSDGYWIINGTKTEYKAIGKDGTNGTNGTNGKDGKTPTIEISADGYWVINGTKTEYKAIGKDGVDGTNGTNGKDGKTPTIEISADGYWIINGTKTEYKAIGKDGVDGASIEKIEFDEQGRLVITLTNGIVLDPVELPKKEEHVHSFGGLVEYTQGEMNCEERIYYKVCSTCNVIEWVKGSYNDHKFETVITEPTCVNKGYTTYTCNCGYSYVDNYIDAYGHTEVIDNPVAPNCTETGLTEGKHCSVCKEVLVSQKLVDALGHTLDDSGYCTVCDTPIGTTKGIYYDLSSDGTYYEVIGYEGTAKRVIIAETYNNLPVKTIYSEAFKNTEITSVVIPDSVTSIGDRAFYYCNFLTSVVIGDSVTSIGDQAFDCCRSLTSVVIGDSVISIGEDAFSASNSALCTTENNLIYVKANGNNYCILIGATNKNLSTYQINENTKHIAYGAFRGCERLSTITIPNSVTSIGKEAFYNCDSLTSVTIGDSVTSIGSYAFAHCDSLTSVVIGYSVTNMGSYAFAYCTSLISIEIPNSVTSIGDYAFIQCYGLTSIKYTGTQTQWDEINKGLNWNDRTGNFTITYNYKD